MFGAVQEKLIWMDNPTIPYAAAFDSQNRAIGHSDGSLCRYAVDSASA